MGLNLISLCPIRAGAFGLKDTHPGRIIGTDAGRKGDDGFNSSHSQQTAARGRTCSSVSAQPTLGGVNPAHCPPPPLVSIVSATQGAALRYRCTGKLTYTFLYVCILVTLFCLTCFNTLPSCLLQKCSCSELQWGANLPPLPPEPPQETPLLAVGSPSLQRCECEKGSTSYRGP